MASMMKVKPNMYNKVEMRELNVSLPIKSCATHKEDGEETRYRHDAETSNLYEKRDDNLSFVGECLGNIDCGKSCDADRASGYEDGICNGKHDMLLSRTRKQ